MVLQFGRRCSHWGHVDTAICHEREREELDFSSDSGKDNEFGGWAVKVITNLKTEQTTNLKEKVRLSYRELIH